MSTVRQKTSNCVSQTTSQPPSLWLANPKGGSCTGAQPTIISAGLILITAAPCCSLGRQQEKRWRGQGTLRHACDAAAQAATGTYTHWQCHWVECTKLVYQKKHICPDPKDNAEKTWTGWKPHAQYNPATDYGSWHDVSTSSQEEPTT